MLHQPVIAIVDDDESVRRALARLLRTAGMQTRTYSAAASFVEDAQHRVPDCVVLDVQMPGGSGLHVQQRLRSLGLRVPLIFITAHDDEAARHQALDGGATAYLRKPVAGENLLAAIQCALEFDPVAEAVNPVANSAIA